MKQVLPLVRWFRWLRLLLSFLACLGVACVYPLVSQRFGLRLRQRCSQGMVAALGIQLEITGAVSADPGSMLVANNVSWIDIFVINSVLPAAFVAKAEVRRWPVAGWLTAMNETIFLHRGSRGHARQVNEEIADKLAAGKYVAVFPEGKTTDGLRV